MSAPAEKPRRYFISVFFVHPEAGPTFGNCELHWPVPISSCHGPYGTNVIAQKIEEQLGVRGLVVLSFQEFSDPGIVVATGMPGMEK